jgi:beta-phosphoglucomutase-like phosphatase (HAD superfamily)
MHMNLCHTQKALYWLQCVVIEDALAGVQAATAAGMRCIAVTTTLSEDKLMQAGPALVRKDISRISLNDILELGLCALSS